MNARHIELLRRLEQFELDSPAAAFPFSARLARENNWTPQYTRRVIAEYKRFAFLAVAAGHPVSPSEDVDQVWHLHLTYSENYWKIFCPEILGKPFHHQPTRGGESERGKFEDWYARTLQSYRSFFDVEPPLDIWPSPDVRHKEKHEFFRVDRERSWIIPKPRFRLNAKLAAALGLTGLAISCTGAMLADNMNVFDWRGPDFLGFFAVVCAAGFALAFWLRWALRMPSAGNSHDLPELDGYDTAYLNGGRVLAVNTAIANLVNQKALRVDPKEKQIDTIGIEPNLEHPIEQAVYAAAESGARIGDVRQFAKPKIERLVDDLKARGLVVGDAQARKAIAIPLILSLAVLTVGVVKLLIGLNRGKPIGILAAMLIVFFVISLIAFARWPLRSRYGDEVLRKLQARHIGSRTLGKRVSSIPATEFAMVVGLFGLTALAGTDLADLRQDLQPPSGSASGCGGSCGGGCGGGCGGCGGGD